MKVFDLLLNSAEDLDIQGGDLVVGESTRQNQKLILYANPGEFRAAPQVGVGIQSMILDDAPTAAITSEIQQQMEMDGLLIQSLSLNADGTVELGAYYRDSND